MQKRSAKPRYFSKLPRIAQISNSHCGIAVATMLLGNLDIKTTQEEVEAKAKISKRKIASYGINVPELGQACKKNGKVDFWMKENARFSDIKVLLKVNKAPVGIEWQGDFGEFDNGEYGHYSVATHVDETKQLIYIADPYKHFAGKDRKLKISKFKRLWWDVNEIKDPKTKKMRIVKDNKMIFVVTKKGETFPEKLGMSKV